MQHLPILKICSCPCQAGPNGFRGFFEAQNADKNDDDWAERHEEVYEVHRSSLSF